MTLPPSRSLTNGVKVDLLLPNPSPSPLTCHLYLHLIPRRRLPTRREPLLQPHTRHSSPRLAREKEPQLSFSALIEWPAAGNSIKAREAAPPSAVSRVC
ncbi:hypothetical protein CRG98_007002 [Punica granatum]|uniref:Uncharacterized protein n=1 Tax=Punica granatum TaxID=22663 RepID=A0A2I0KVX8_PUNGR|nr:hypothetical protein CRG98_007002 [Punica granatum]